MEWLSRESALKFIILYRILKEYFLNCLMKRYSEECDRLNCKEGFLNLERVSEESLICVSRQVAFGAEIGAPFIFSS